MAAPRPAASSSSSVRRRGVADPPPLGRHRPEKFFFPSGPTDGIGEEEWRICLLCCELATPYHGKAPTSTQGRTGIRSRDLLVGGRHHTYSSLQPVPTQKVTIKEEVDANEDANVQALCHKHRKPLEYLHSPRRTVPEKHLSNQRKRIHLDDGKYIVRAELMFVMGIKLLLLPHVAQWKPLLSNKSLR